MCSAHIHACVCVCDFQFPTINLGAVAIFRSMGKLKKEAAQVKGDNKLAWMHGCMRQQRANHYIPAKSNRVGPWCEYSPTMHPCYVLLATSISYI